MNKFLYFPISAAKDLEQNHNTTYESIYNEYRALPGAVVSGANCDYTPFCPNFLDGITILGEKFTHPLLGECRVFQDANPLSLMMPQNSELKVLFDMLWGTFYSSYFDPTHEVRETVDLLKPCDIFCFFTQDINEKYSLNSTEFEIDDQLSSPQDSTNNGNETKQENAGQTGNMTNEAKMNDTQPEEEDDDSDDYPLEGINIYFYNKGHFYSSNLLEKDSIKQPNL